mgnify:CR=1 FL=1
MTDFLSYRLVQGFMYESGFDVSDPDKAMEFPSAKFMKLASRLVQYGADCELEACIDWIAVYQGLEHPELLIELLRAARRPKAPSLAEEALEAQKRLWDGKSTHDDWRLIGRALERLQELEGGNG